MTLYCGIDLHANNSVISVIDDRDVVLYEKRHPNDLQGIQDAIEPFREDLLACVIESTYNWYWLVDGLMDAGFDVRLAHTGAIPQYAGIKHSNDQTDARHLAHLLRLGILPEGHIQPRDQRAVRDLLRRRLLLVRQKTLYHLSLQSLIVRHTGERLLANQIKALDNEAIAEKLDGPICLGGQITHLARCWHERAIGMLEDEVLKHLKPRQEYQLLNSLPGVGKILASSCWRPVPSNAFPMPGTTPRTRAASIPNGSATASSRAGATSATATNTWPGRSWRRRTMQPSGVLRSNAFTRNAKPSGTCWWPKRP